MVFLNAYFDASYDKGDTDWCVVGGYAGRAEDFADLEERWNGLLAIDFRLEEDRVFHFTEFKRRFGDWEAKVSRYAELLGSSNLFGVSAVINHKVWSELEVSSKYKKIFPRREHACLDLALSTMADAIDVGKLSGPLALTIDNDYGSRLSAAAVFDNWEKRTSHSTLTFSVAAPGASRHILPLQFADLFANAIRNSPMTGRHLSDLTEGEMDAYVKSPFSKVSKNGRARYWSPKYATNLAEQAASFDNLVAIPV